MNILTLPVRRVRYGQRDWRMAPIPSLPRSGAPQRVADDATRTATIDDVAVLADVLARAFARDPVHCWLFPSHAQRARGSRRFWTVILQHAVRHGSVLTTHGCEGVA